MKVTPPCAWSTIALQSLIPDHFPIPFDMVFLGKSIFVSELRLFTDKIKLTRQN